MTITHGLVRVPELSVLSSICTVGVWIARRPSSQSAYRMSDHPSKGGCDGSRTYARGGTQ